MKNKDNNLFIDVDETLIRDCLEQETPDITFLFEKTYFNKKINKPLIEKIKTESKNKFIVIWTSNSFGEIWAQEIVKQLQIENFIDLTLFKPVEIIDDSPLHDWFINPKKPPLF